MYVIRITEDIGSLTLEWTLILYDDGDFEICDGDQYDSWDLECTYSGDAATFGNLLKLVLPVPLILHNLKVSQTKATGQYSLNQILNFE